MPFREIGLSCQGGSICTDTHPVLLSFLAGFLFPNPVHAQLVDAGAGENKAAPTGSFTITDVTLPGILFAYDGGTITAGGGAYP